MRELIICPRPKSVIYKSGELERGDGFAYSGEFKDAAQRSSLIYPELLGGTTALRADYSPELGDEEYYLTVSCGGVSVLCGGEKGAFYALVTLGQIAAQCRRIPCMEIHDLPDFAHRGIMVDISRNRIPTLDTLKQTVDFAARLKINQFQLYIEGKSFLYPSLSGYYAADADILTAAELSELDGYCKRRFVELVPALNCFGHMSEWLDGDFRHLAECPDGFDYYGIKTPPSTLNPLNPQSLEFVKKQLGDVLPLFGGADVNIGGDEPFELGEGASKAVCAERGRGRVYLDFISGVFDCVARSGKKPMMWGDVFKTHYDECCGELNRDVTVLEWGYSADSFTDDVCSLYKNAKVRYYLCPGTSLWNTVTGKTDNMLANVKSAARLGLKHGCNGILTVNWGDGGTCQPLVCSLFCYAFGAAYSWNGTADSDGTVKEYISRFVFGDSGGTAGELIYDLGNYYKCADRDDENATKIFKLLYVQQTDCMNVTEGNYEPLFTNRDFTYLKPEEYERTLQYLNGIKERLDKIKRTEKNKIFCGELDWAIGYLMHGCKLGVIKSRQFTREQICGMHREITRLNSLYRRIWAKQNKRTGLEQSMMRMQSLRRKYAAIAEL